LVDPINTHVVRFFDSSDSSVTTHDLWTTIDTELSKSQLYQSVITHQINCNATENWAYCDQMQIDRKPEILVLRENNVVGYFSQKRQIEDFDKGSFKDVKCCVGDSHNFLI
jgi:hypothetical protein